MKSLWKKDFKPLATDTPKDIVEYQCASLNKITNGIIVAGVTEYSELYPSNDLFPSDKLYPSKELSSSVGEVSGGQAANLKNKVGEKAGYGFTYEFYISSIASPNYRYRVMFLQYGTSMYPLTIIMDEAIADELNLEQQTVCASQEDFESTLEKIINSDKVGKVISVLLGNAEKSGRVPA
jgi:hypothetical protein